MEVVLPYPVLICTINASSNPLFEGHLHLPFLHLLLLPALLHLFLLISPRRQKWGPCSQSTGKGGSHRAGTWDTGRSWLQVLFSHLLPGYFCGLVAAMGGREEKKGERLTLRYRLDSNKTCGVFNFPTVHPQTHLLRNSQPKWEVWGPSPSFCSHNCSALPSVPWLYLWVYELTPSWCMSGLRWNSSYNNPVALHFINHSVGEAALQFSVWFDFIHPVFLQNRWLSASDNVWFNLEHYGFELPFS